MSSCIHEDDSPVPVPAFGGIISPNVGGGTEPNQVWIDLSENSESSAQAKATLRDSWDLGFYCGDDFRVIINSSIMMAVGKIEGATGLAAVNSQSVSNLKNVVEVGTFLPNAQYIDDPSGNYLTQTSGIAAISATDAQNAVYLLNMGKNIPTDQPSLGGVNTAGTARGWKKIKISREGAGYKLQYADLDATSGFQTMIINKNSDYNFRFVSLNANAMVDVQPQKKKWDLCYSVMTNLTLNPYDNQMTSYIFPDMVITNIMGGVKAYQVKVAAGQGTTAYNNFTKTDVDENLFVANDQRVIGSNWRSTTGSNGAEVYGDRFYVIKDPDGYYYKLQFLKMKNTAGERGYPQFQYSPL